MTEASEDMQLKAPNVKYEINLNTIIVLVGFASTTLAGGNMWGAVTTRLGNLESQVAERAQQTTKDVATLATRIDGLDAEVRKYDNLSYRVTVQEQSSASLAKSVEELKTAINSQGADVRVIREILTRLDRSDIRGTAKP